MHIVIYREYDEEKGYPEGGIAGKMIEYVKEKYKDFLYIEGMPADHG